MPLHTCTPSVSDKVLDAIDCDSLTPEVYEHDVGQIKYDLSTQKMNWQDSRAYCKSRGGDMAFTGLKDMALRK